jgi:hypothetical protein
MSYRISILKSKAVRYEGRSVTSKLVDIVNKPFAKFRGVGVDMLRHRDVEPF